MNRRKFLKAMGVGLAINAMPGVKLYAADENYTGKFLITLRANGGWDQTLFCDPKENVPGERKITNWSINEQTRKAGNIPYAPFGKTPDFFEKYYQDILVVNGINTKRNAHNGSRQVMNTGARGGKPSVSALFAGVYGSTMTLPWLAAPSDRTWSGKLTPRTRLGSDDGLLPLIEPQKQSLGSSNVSLHTKDYELMNNFLGNELTHIEADEFRVPRATQMLKEFERSSKQDPRIKALSTILTTAERSAFRKNSVNESTLFAMAAFKSGMSVAADYQTGGFDTHNSNDRRQESQYNTLLEAVDFIWYLAEQMDIQDRIIVQLESDFGRTPRYNSNNEGKDHWSVGSKVIMEKNASYTNRVLGGTDEGLKALKFDPATLEPSSTGTQIGAHHFNHAFREYLGLNAHPYGQKYHLTNTLMPFFS